MMGGKRGDGSEGGKVSSEALSLEDKSGIYFFSDSYGMTFWSLMLGRA